MVNVTVQLSIDTTNQVKTKRKKERGEEKQQLNFSMCTDEKLLQFLMSKDFTARYAADDDQYEDEGRYFQERQANLPPQSLIEQMVD